MWLQEYNAHKIIDISTELPRSMHSLIDIKWFHGPLGKLPVFLYKYGINFTPYPMQAVIWTESARNVAFDCIGSLTKILHLDITIPDDI